MDKSCIKPFPANREFVKSFRHNKQNYILRSIYDADNKYDFDNIVKYNKNTRNYDFDAAVKRKYTELYPALNNIVTD